MKTLHVYITRQILGTLLMTVLVFTFVLLLGNVVKEVLRLLLSGATSLPVVAKAIGLLIPFVLVFALPMGMLTATLLFFGRFSADQELTAVRASGISLIALCTPIFVLSLVLSAVCAWVNFDLAPRCRVAYKNLLMNAGLSNPLSFLPEKQFISDLPGGYTMYVDKKEGTNLSGIFLHQTREKEGSEVWQSAATGTLAYDDARQMITLTLNNPSIGLQKGTNIQPLLFRERTEGTPGQVDVEISLAQTQGKAQEVKFSDMTFQQLRSKLQELEERPIQSNPIPPSTPAELKMQMETLKLKLTESAMQARVQMNRMVSFSFACVGFTLIGIPLGIRAHRRETSAGIAAALVLVLIYYCFIILGESLDRRPELAPHLIVWLPNFLFQAVGGVLLWRANKGV